MPFHSARVLSATLQGVDPCAVEVEVIITTGIPSFSIVGMPDTSIQESRERVRSAIKASGFRMPTDKIVVNLAPGSLRKHGSGFDLPIAMGLLAASGQIPADALEHLVVVGELSLEGDIRAPQGLFAYQLCARKLERSLLTGTMHEGYVPLPGLVCYELACLGDCAGENLQSLAPYEFDPHHDDLSRETHDEEILDFAAVKGHEAAKYALQIAVAGLHNVVMIGPPGSGKSMLARALPSIMPTLSNQEMLDVALIHSVAGLSVQSLQKKSHPLEVLTIQ